MLLGCGGGEDEPSGSYTLEEFKVAASAERCEALAQCGFYEKAEDCKEFRYVFAPLTNYLELELAIDAGRITYDGEAAFACASAIGNPSCERGVDVPIPPVCKTVFQGSAGIDDDCLINQECDGGMQCGLLFAPESEAFPSCTVGQCHSDTTRTLGQECFNRDCATDLYCNRSFTCAALIRPGEACTPVGNSEVVACTQGYGCVDNVCTAQPKTGEACTFVIGCRIISDHCSASGQPEDSPICQLRKANGEACERRQECVLNSRCLEGFCQKAGDIGDACSDENWCQIPLSCSFEGGNNSCALPPEATETCPS